MTKQEAIENHRRMWRWIAEETRKQKRCVKKYEYLRSQGIKPYGILYDCFCCQFSADYPDDHAECERCPIEFDSTADSHMCQFTSNDYSRINFRDGLYAAWTLDCGSDDWEHAAEMADIISTLSERFW